MAKNRKPLDEWDVPDVVFFLNGKLREYEADLAEFGPNYRSDSLHPADRIEEYGRLFVEIADLTEKENGAIATIAAAMAQAYKASEAGWVIS